MECGRMSLVSSYLNRGDELEALQIQLSCPSCHEFRTYVLDMQAVKSMHQV